MGNCLKKQIGLLDINRYPVVPQPYLVICSGLAAICNESYRLRKLRVCQNSYFFTVTGSSAVYR